MVNKNFIILFLLVWNTVSGQTKVDEVLKSFQNDPELKHASYSFCIMNAADGKTIQEFQSDLSLSPASTLKIVTTSAAIGILGKNFTYKTYIYFTGKFDSISGVLNGNILIKGSGDPTINSEYFYLNAENHVLIQWAEQLKKIGLKKVNGMVITDAHVFDNRIPDQWIWADIGNYFGAGAHGLSYADNKYTLTLQSFDEGLPVKIKNQTYRFSTKMNSGWDIPENHFNNALTSGGKGDNAIIYPNGLIAGTIPANKSSYEIEGNMTHPDLVLRNEFENILEAKGIQILYDFDNIENQDSILNQRFDYSGYKLVYTHLSPTLDKIVYYTNMKSDNHYAETLLNTLASVKTKQTGTTNNGIEVVTAFWKDRGVDVSGLFMDDGSGLSRSNAITTKIQATILSKIYRDSTLYTAFNSSLPIAGKNGSMSSLCKGTFAENNLRAKTGYINRVRAYAGYTTSKSGKKIAFSIIFNNYSCSPKEMKLKIEKWMIAITEL